MTIFQVIKFGKYTTIWKINLSITAMRNCWEVPLKICIHWDCRRDLEDRRDEKV